MIHPAVAVLEHSLVNYRRTWRGTIFSAFGLPVLFLLAMGKGVGGYVDARSALGVPYLDFIAPGVLASTTLQVGIFESAYPVFSAFHWSRGYHAMRDSALRPVDILAGHLGFVVLRVTMTGLGFLAVMAVFGTVHTGWGLLALPAGTLVGLAVATPVFAYSAVIRSENMFAVLFRFAMIPMTLFAGVFFPVDRMPVAARGLAYVSPLWHGVELCRAATLGTDPAWGVPLHVTCLLVWCVGGLALARLAFNRALTD